MTDIRTIQPSFSGGELSPALYARVDVAKYAVGLKTARNVFIHPHGGASNRAGLEFVREVKDSTKFTRLVPFQFNTEQSYILEMGDAYMRVFKDGALVLVSGSPYELTTAFSTAILRDLVFTQDADVMYFTHTSLAPRKLGRLADNNWTMTTPTFAPKMTPPVATGAYPGGPNIGSSDTYSYKVAAISDDSGEESLPSNMVSCVNDLSIAGNFNQVAWSAVSGASRYIVYKEDNGVYGYIGGTTGLFFDDENITADLADGPQSAYNPFSGSGNYPRCSTFADQRLLFASSLNNPQAVWASQVANYENFGFSRPRKASDGFEFRIRSRQVNEIRAMIQLRGLMVLTSGSENIVTGGQDEYLNPTNIVVKTQSYRGCAELQPIVVGAQVLFAQDRGGVVRDFSYEFSEDAYTGKDLTILARHLFEGRSIVAWAYSQAPYSIVWCVLDNGSMVSLTYLKEHDVWAWTRHQTDGLFEDVAVIAEGDEDVPYFIVRRTIGGVQKRYIERLHTRNFTSIEDAFFVDSGLSYSGSPISTVSGLSHLEGKAVVALVDGNVVVDLVVSGGAVTLPFAGSKIHVGLPYDAAIKTLDPDLGNVTGLGSVQARQKKIAKVSLRVEKMRGVWVGLYDDVRSSGRLIEYKQRSTEAWDEAIGLYTGDIEMEILSDWNQSGNVVVKQFDPLPMTILAIMSDIKVGK